MPIYANDILPADFIVTGIQAAPLNRTAAPDEVKGHLWQSILGEISEPEVSAARQRTVGLMSYIRKVSLHLIFYRIK